jgi:hypothetical protein
MISLEDERILDIVKQSVKRLMNQGYIPVERENIKFHHVITATTAICSDWVKKRNWCMICKDLPENCVFCRRELEKQSN